MVTKCANPSCTTRFLYFRGGKLFAFAPSPIAMTHARDFQGRGRDAEWFWLCEQCALTMTIISGRTGEPRNDGLKQVRVVQIGTDDCRVHSYLRRKEHHA